MSNTGWKSLAAAIALGLVGASHGAIAGDIKEYRVTIANATGGQPLAPGLVITHDRDFSLFAVNDAPSLELAEMAETGNPGPLAGVVGAMPGVGSADVLLGGGAMPPLALPGEANSIIIATSGDAKFFSATGMLAATNDAIYAVRGVRLPKKGSVTVHAIAYDAGSEANNEADGDVPATPGGNALDAGIDAGDGEGFIHVHRGIHGGAALDPAAHDWRNPVVEITIERLRD